MALDVIDKSKEASDRKVFIYGLKCPITEQIRYIGKTYNLKSRYSRHITEKKKYHKNLWINKLKELGLKPELVVMDEVSELDWEKCEKQYILLFKSFGADLTNKTVGGDITPDSVGDKNGNWGKFGELNHRSKPVYVFTKEGVFLEEVGSMRVCSRKYNVDFSSIVRCCKKELIQSNGFVFRYKDDFFIKPELINVPKKNMRKGSSHGMSISISQFGKDGVFIKSYNSISEASIHTNISISAIRKILNKEVNPRKYQFKYNK